MDNEKIKVDDFVAQYKEAQNKEGFIKKHIIKTYEPYALKIVTCQRVIDRAMYITVKNNDGAEKKKFQLNTPLRYMLFLMSMVIEYTDIEFSSDRAMDDYDSLVSSGAMSSIIGGIGEDFAQYKSVMDMMVDDLMDRERNLIDWIETKEEATVKAIQEYVNQQKEAKVNG